MSQEFESAKPLTDWQYTEDGFLYRWVLLSADEITALREKTQRPRENTEPSACTQDKYAVHE